MPLITNQGSHLTTVVLPRSTALEAASRIAFVPGILTPVSSADWLRCKKVKMVQDYLDNGTLIEGKAAAEVAKDANVQDEIVKDLAKQAAIDEEEAKGNKNAGAEALANAGNAKAAKAKATKVAAEEEDLL